VRRVDGLVLDVDECRRLAPTLATAAGLLRDVGDHAGADDVARVALAAGAVAATVAPAGHIVADARHGQPATVTLAAWAHSHDVAVRTARRWATRGELPGAIRTGGRWMVSDDGETARPVE
jgi:hypothetical protein